MKIVDMQNQFVLVYLQADNNQNKENIVKIRIQIYWAI